MESEPGLEDDLFRGRMRCKRLAAEPSQGNGNALPPSGPPVRRPGILPAYSGSSHPSPPLNPTSQTPRNLPQPIPHRLSRYPPSCGSVQTSKALIREFADKVAGIFIPTILSLSAITFVVWMTVGHIVDGSSLSPQYSATLAPQNLTLHLRHCPCLSLRSRTEYSNRRNGWDRCWPPERDLDLGREGFGTQELAVSKRSS